MLEKIQYGHQVFKTCKEMEVFMNVCKTVTWMLLLRAYKKMRKLTLQIPIKRSTQ